MTVAVLASMLFFAAACNNSGEPQTATDTPGDTTTTAAPPPPNPVSHTPGGGVYDSSGQQAISAGTEPVRERQASNGGGADAAKPADKTSQPANKDSLNNHTGSAAGK